MAATTTDDVKRYLWLQGVTADDSINPVDLLRDLLNENEKLQAECDKLQDLVDGIEEPEEPNQSVSELRP